MPARIAHPTDFSPEGVLAFEHALALALQYRCRLDLMHVHQFEEADRFGGFPHVREALHRWGRLAQGAPVSAIAETLGVTVAKVEIRDVDPVAGITHYLATHRPDLLVMASHGRTGFERLLRGSVSNEIARDAHVPTLFLGPECRGFVAHGDGAIQIESVLLPVDHEPAPHGALPRMRALLEGLNPAIDAIHVGVREPVLGGGIAARLVDGPVLDAIAREGAQADLIVMPTAGRKGLGEMVRGSTTERLLHCAPCPVLALPSR